MVRRKVIGMFMSEYNHTLDTKGRLIVPQKFREQLGEEFILSRGMDHCLCIYSKDEWEKFTSKLGSVPELSNPNGRKLARFFIAGSTTCEVDKQGRNLIPANLRTFAGLDKEVVLAGVGNRIEVWDKLAWEDYNDFDDVEGLAGSLEPFGI